MSPGDKESSDGSNYSPTQSRPPRDIITTTFVTSDMDCSCSEFDNEGNNFPLSSHFNPFLLNKKIN